MANESTLRIGHHVLTWTGEHGLVIYCTKDNCFGVRLFGEQRVDEWQAQQLEVVL